MCMVLSLEKSLALRSQKWVMQRAKQVVMKARLLRTDGIYLGTEDPYMI